MKACRTGGVVAGIVTLAFVAAGRAEEGRMLREIKQAAAGAKISLTQAIEAAQKEVADGRVIEAALEWDQQPAGYAVDLLVGDKVKKAKIDAATGKVLDVKDETLDEEEASEIAELKKALAGVKVTPAEAIAAAEKEIKDGQALSIELSVENGKAGYDVSLLQGDKVMDGTVAAAAGKLSDVEERPLPLAYWTFDKDDVGNTPAGLSARETHPGSKPGLWKVAADQTAPSPPNVLTLKTEATGSTYNLALFEKTGYKDVDLRVRVKANTGKEDQGGGLVWRCKGENNYYVCRMNPLETNFRVYKVVDGKRQQLASTEIETKAGKWYRLRITMVGDQITCFLDGKKYLSVKDDTFKDAGMLGLWTKADASSSFDNLVLYAPATWTPEKSKAGDEQAGQKPKEQDEEDDD